MLPLTDLSGPGIDDLLKGSLTNWGIEYLTDVQRTALEAGIASGGNFIVCAPTSTGKTLIAEIAVHQALRRGDRCLYLVSHKALAVQKYNDFLIKFGQENSNPFGSVAISTGDLEEGDIQSDILVSTYEKGLVLVLSGQLDPHDCVVVADELQIIGDPTRGAGIEIFCASLRQKTVKQFLALTATVENPNDLASWLECELVQSHTRDVDLFQEIWYRRQCYRITFGQDTGAVDNNYRYYPSDLLDVVDHLIRQERAPILVFTESRREASRFADIFGRRRQKHASAIGIAEQLELFSEPTEVSANLQNSAERRIAIHTADLSPQERQVIEKGFLNGEFDVCFATSTLAAGVNFPFRTVVFPKLTYQYGDRAGTRISRADYRNMSGRAGRLGMHDLGYAVLLPKDGPESNHANAIVLPENDRVQSQLARLTMRKAVLALFAAGGVHTKTELKEFFENTYYWYQLVERNPSKLEDVLTSAERALIWLIDDEFLEQDDETFLVTPLGQATAWSGLLPTTVKSFVALLEQHCEDLEDRFSEFTGALIHWVCDSDEFQSESPSRFLPFPIGGESIGSAAFVSSQVLFNQLDRTDTQLCQSVHALCLFIEGIEERIIFRQTKISSGNVHRLAGDISWVIDGLRTIAAVPDVDCPQTVGNYLGMLARRVRWGSREETLDLIRIAHTAHVPGFGRQRAMALARAGIITFENVENIGLNQLSEIVGDRTRAQALLSAIAEVTEFKPNRFELVHRKLSERLGVREIVKDCIESTGNEYEDAIVRLLQLEKAWSISVRDDGRRRNEPDILIRLEGTAILLEVKTATRRVGLVKKEAAFAVLQKATDYEESIYRVTLGKPAFDEMSKVKALASTNITLVEHLPFLEGILRVLAKNITPNAFIEWLVEPGEAEFQRLPGDATNLVV